MKFTSIICSFVALATVQAAAIPSDVTSLSLRSSVAELVESETHLEKRKGGGGRSGGSSSSSSSSGSSGSSGSSSSSSGSGRTSSSSSSGSSTGVRPSYGGGSYYSGGAATPYRSGGRSPGGVAPYFLGAGALGFAGAYAYGAYLYPYNHAYNFHNRSQPANATNTTLPVTCLCEEYQVCGCDNNTSTAYLDEIVGNGSISALNSTVARVADVNGTTTLLINGTLPNGTSDATTTESAAGSFKQGLTETSGLWVIVAGVVYTVWFM